MNCQTPPAYSCRYGGRVTDKWDKRTNLSVLCRFFEPAILEDGTTFSDSGLYYAPPAGTLAAVRAYVEALPPEDKPEVFGLHANAEISLQLKETTELMDTVISMQPRSGGGGATGGKSADDTVLDLAIAIAARLPAPFSKKNAHALTFATIEDGSVNSMGVFLEQVRSRTLVSRAP
jgi:dynein heavy chain